MQLTTVRERLVSVFRLDLDTVLLYSIYLLALTIPAFFGKPQILIGSIVNFLITFSVLKYGFRKTIPVLILPSSSAFVTGLLFSGATPFMLYLIPFIILSNGTLAFVLNWKKNVWGVILGSVLKAGFLFTVVNILINTVGLPKIFLTSMGYVQLITALVGSSCALLVFTLTKKNITK